MGRHFIKFTYSNGNTRIINLGQLSNVHLKHDSNEIDFNGPGSRTTGVSKVSDMNQWEKELVQVLSDYSVSTGPSGTPSGATPNQLKSLETQLNSINDHLSKIQENTTKPPRPPSTNPFGLSLSDSKTKRKK